MPSPSNPGLPYKAVPTRNLKDHWGFYMTEHAGLYQALDSTTGGLAALGVAARDAAISGGIDKFWALADSLLDDALSAEVSGIAEQLAVEAQALAVLGNPA